MTEFKVNKGLQYFYWALMIVVAATLLAEKYAAAAFFALLLIVVQLNEIATYLAHLLTMKIAYHKNKASDVT
jgi:hypothetical protein